MAGATAAPAVTLSQSATQGATRIPFGDKCPRQHEGRARGARSKRPRIRQTRVQRRPRRNAERKRPRIRATQVRGSQGRHYRGRTKRGLWRSQLPHRPEAAEADLRGHRALPSRPKHKRGQALVWTLGAAVCRGRPHSSFARFASVSTGRRSGVHVPGGWVWARRCSACFKVADSLAVSEASACCSPSSTALRAFRRVLRPADVASSR